MSSSNNAGTGQPASMRRVFDFADDDIPAKRIPSREQLEDALELVEAIIARDEAECAANEHDQPPVGSWAELWARPEWVTYNKAWARADELMQLYRARYAHTR